MITYGSFTKLLQLFLITSNHYFFRSIFCERLNDLKTDTKIDIEITYGHEYHEDKPQPHPEKRYKIAQNLYTIPHFLKPDRGTNRPSNNNNNNGGNIRHSIRFSTIDKGAGTLTYDTDSGDNGPRVFKQFGVSGSLIHVLSVTGKHGDNSSLSFSHTACEETLNYVPTSWIALIQDGSCGPEQKIKHVMKMSNQPITIIMYGSSKINVKQDSYPSIAQDEIPTVIFLPWNIINGIVQRCYNSSGQVTIPPELLPKMNKSFIDLATNNKNHCNVSIRIYLSTDDNFLNKTSVLFVSISFILLMVISLAWLMFYYVQRFRYIHTKEQFSRRLAHMAKKAVAKIPVKTLKQGDRETDSDLDNCAICIECYKPSDNVRILPCKHYFHKSCIDPWLLEQRSCPMCKLNILHAYGFLPNERGSIISDDRLSELDSSLELQFMSGNVVPARPTTTTRVQAYCQARDANYINVSTLPPIFTEPNCRSTNRWSSLLLKRPPRVSHRIDRSISLRHLNGSIEERVTFLSHNRLLSHSANDNTVTVQDSNAPRMPTVQWQPTATSSTNGAPVPGSQPTISSP